MAESDPLLVAVREAEAAEDPDRVDAAREAWLETNPQGHDAADVRYRHGLSKLFRHRDQNAAMELFKAAAKEKGATSAPEARVSYALILHAKNKRQQAVFELRKLLPVGAPPTMHTANALDFLALILREQGASEADQAKVAETRIAHLKQLADDVVDPVEKAHWLLRLAAALADDDRPTSLEKARAIYQQIIKLGAKAGQSALDMARASLKSLPR